MKPRRRRDIWDVVIIGGGIAGLTAAWHAARRGLATALFEGAPAHGGLVANVNHLDDWPATAATSGVELAAGLAAQARDENVELYNELVRGVRRDGKVYRIEAEAHELRTRGVVVASGARLKALDVPGASQLVGKGVSQCADCDGYFFRNQDVVVVGAGDGALHEALVLTGICRTVTIVVRSKVTARASYVERAAGAANVRFVWDSEVDRVLGADGVSGVALRNLKSGAITELACSGVFPFIGVMPNTDFLGSEVNRDAAGCVVTDARMRSSAPAIYAVGAARAGYSGALVSAAGEAAAAVGSLASDLAL
ncbi:MAG: NAD(P)/FAD-dependent oxidoreductase [Rhodospirillaceae bacterium]